MIESEYNLALRRAEADWVRGLLKELTGGTFPGVNDWRTFFETGQIPEDVTALMADKGERQAAN